MRGPDRPLLRYYGGKWMLAPWVISHFPRHRVYTEPFGGAASVLLRKPRSYSEVYNDLDGEIVNLFRVMREQPRELIRAVGRTPFARDEYQLAQEPCEDPLESARRLVVRSFMGFGSNAVNRSLRSGFRANANRSGTTPAHDWSNLPGNLRAVARRLRGVVIENRPALEVICQQDGTDALHYVDPPYPHSTRSDRAKHSYAHEMSDEDHRHLAVQLHMVHGAVVVSSYPSTLYEDLYDDWFRVEREALADGARPRTEVLWVNATAQARMPQRSLFSEAAR